MWFIGIRQTYYINMSTVVIVTHGINLKNRARGTLSYSRAIIEHLIQQKPPNHHNINYNIPNIPISPIQLAKIYLARTNKS